MQLHEKIAVVGIGLVGLELALAFDEIFPGTVAYDIDQLRSDELRQGVDRNGQVTSERLKCSSVIFTSDEALLGTATFFLVAVQTELTTNNDPDLSALASASRTIGRHLSGGAVVVYESTVPPGTTEHCRAILQQQSGLAAGLAFKVGYSPERINLGDKEHQISNITKVVSGEDEEALRRISAVYRAVIRHGVFEAPSIMAAECAKLLENVQRDVNIALMNEFGQLLGRIGVPSQWVLATAATKWNFASYRPGLVGGDCIALASNCLLSTAQKFGVQPRLLSTARSVNEEALNLILNRIMHELPGGSARVAVLGLTYKENIKVPRGSKAAELVEKLCAAGVQVFVNDPGLSELDWTKLCRLPRSELLQLTDMDVVVLAVPHREFVEAGVEALCSSLRDGGLFLDLTCSLDPAKVPSRVRFCSP